MSLGTTLPDIDVSKPLSRDDVRRILRALGEHAVVCFPRQTVNAVQLKAFSCNFGSLEINVANFFQEPNHPEIMILSNMQDNGKPIGAADAGQEWHTDMSYSETIAFLNVLYAIEVPRRDGRVLGDTQFADMRAAYADLPNDIKERLADATAVHDFDKYWEMMHQRGTRKRLTREQRRQKPPVAHPIFLTHPITGDKVLYANPGYTVYIEGMPRSESDELLAFLFAHQLKEDYRYVHHWTEGDVLVWDDLQTLHKAVPDYDSGEHRLIKRCQVMADKIFDAKFVAEILKGESGAQVSAYRR